LRFWQIPDGAERFPTADYDKAEPALGYLTAIMPDGELLFTTRVENEKRWSRKLVQLESGSLLLGIESAEVCPGYLSADKRTLASFSPDSTDPHAEVWNIPSRHKIATLPTGPPLAVSPDGRTVLCCTDRNAAIDKSKREFALWDVEQRRELGRVTIPENMFAFARFSPNGTVFGISGTAERPPPFLKLFHVNAQRGIEEIVGVNMFFDDFAFGANGSVVVADNARAGNRVRWYDIADGQAHEAGSELCSRPHSWSALRAPSPDGKVLTVQSRILMTNFAPPSWRWLPASLRTEYWQSEVSLFDMETRERLGVLSGIHQVGQVRFSSDSAMFAVATEDGRMTVWELPPRKPLLLAALIATAFVGAVWAGRMGYRRFRRRGAPDMAERGRSPLNLV
jgi:WD40 repeat protein